jgi:tetratricopeptide (TPR) repeat protein
MPRAPTERAHIAFTHHQIGIHPLQDNPSPEGDDQLVPLFDLAELSAGDRQRSLGLAWQQRSTHPGEDATAVRLRRNAAARAEELLTTLPEHYIDGAVEMALASTYFIRNEFPRAEASARRALAHEDSTSDEKTSALAMLAGIDFERQRFSDAGGSFAELTRLRRYAGDWYYLGICKSRGGDIAGGIRALEVARELDPEHVETYEKLARMHHARKDRAAESRMQKAIDRLTAGARRSR